MVPLFAVVACVFFRMAKPVYKTSLDSVSAGPDGNKFWDNLFKEVSQLCAPTRDCEGDCPYPPAQTSLSLAGPNSCSLHKTHVIYQCYVTNGVGRAEGSSCFPRRLGEQVPLGACETKRTLQQPCSSKKAWLRVVRRVVTYGGAQYRGRWYRLAMLSPSDIRRVQSRMCQARTGVRQKRSQPSQTSSSPSACMSVCLC